MSPFSDPCGHWMEHFVSPKSQATVQATFELMLSSAHEE